MCIGSDTSNLSRVEKDLNVAEVCASFGHFVKFIVSVEKPGESSGVTVSRNAFAIMMRSQHSACQPSLPNPLVERTRKDKLFNDILQLVAKQGLKFSPGQLEAGKSFLSTVTSVLWYIDQHQSSLASRGCNVPELFKSFQGYNCPELSKHRKHDHEI